MKLTPQQIDHLRALSRKHVVATWDFYGTRFIDRRSRKEIGRANFNVIGALVRRKLITLKVERRPMVWDWWQITLKGRRELAANGESRAKEVGGLF